MFSFNAHVGACDKCTGLGFIKSIDPKLFVPDKSKTIRQGAIGPVTENSDWILSTIEGLGKQFGFTLDMPIGDFTEKQYNVLMYGTDEKVKLVRDVKRKNYSYTYEREAQFKGLIPLYQNQCASML
ncbi:MAG: hypothetical protein ACTSR1_03095 [Candidatus Heimdallarchaeota archaeon]